MSIQIDEAAAVKLLRKLLEEVKETPSKTCLIKEVIDLTNKGKGCLAYRYILFSALTAKAVEPLVDILSLQHQDESPGAYEARGLCSKVIVPFQDQYLNNVLGSSDPLVGKPGRYKRLSPENAARGDGRRVLNRLCEDLPKVKTESEAKDCLRYLLTYWWKYAQDLASRQAEATQSAKGSDVFKCRALIENFLGRGFGGAALVVSTAAMIRVIFPSPDYKVRVHPVNQSGLSSQQFSDIDVYKDDKPYLAVECKDKQFVEREVKKAVKTSTKVAVERVMFVAGRQSRGYTKGDEYFKELRQTCDQSNIRLGIVDIDDLVDCVFTCYEFDPGKLIEQMSEDVGVAGSVEAQLWLYDEISNLGKD